MGQPGISGRFVETKIVASPLIQVPCYPEFSLGEPSQCTLDSFEGTPGRVQS